MNAQAYTTTVNNGPVPVIFRRDAAGNRVVFLQSELDLSVEGGRIKIWHEGKGKQTAEVPLSYYHATTKLSDVDAMELANKFAEGFQPKFGVAVRHRLAKDLSQHPSVAKAADTTKDNNRRASDTEAAPFDKNAFVEKIILAVTTALREAAKE